MGINDTNKTIVITYDSSNISVKIKGENLSDSIWSQLILLFSSGSNNLEQISKWILKLPWHEFIKVLKPFADFIQNQEINIQYDELSKKLINTHLQDIFSLESIIKGEVKEFNILEELTQTNFIRKLTKEQVRDSLKLLNLGHGANFSVPGSGKTTTLLAINSILRKKKNIDKLVVVGPRNAFISWDDEIKACFGKYAPEIVRLTGGKDKISKLLHEAPEITLITYHQLPLVIDQIASFINRNKVHLVLDESHRIKGGSPKVHYSAVIKLADIARRRDIMSGTPMPQSTDDLKPQIEFLWPGANILENALAISDEEKRIGVVNKILKPLYVRTTKSELGISPPRLYTTEIELGPAQNDLYNLLKSETARLLSGMNRDDIKTFRRLGKQVVRLLQVASNPMLVTNYEEYFEETASIPLNTRKWELLTEYSKYEKPVKIEYAVKRVRDLVNTGRKVVVWSTFVQNIQLLEKLLANEGSVSIYGAIETGDENEAQTREWRIRRFHEDPTCRVLIGNPAACGEGISLHKVSHYAIYVDRSFNAAHYLQSLDRIHRLGIPKNIVTEVEILQAKNTIDCVVDDRLKEKISVMSSVLDDFDLKALAYDPEDIIEDVDGGIDKNDFDKIKNHVESDS
jgi:SNF2 family DNA or RNA helicase